MDTFLLENNWSRSEDSLIDYYREDDDWEAKESRGGQIKFTYSNDQNVDIKLDLLFQATANSKPNRKFWDGMMSIPETQMPDIVMRLHRNDIPHQPIYTWLFDAKYRIGEGNGAPDDAINQMHRYRDAILWSAEASGTSTLMRESLGGYILYPNLDEEGKRYKKQKEAIEKVNIGSLPLVPHKKDSEKRNKNFEEQINNLLRLEEKGEDQWTLREEQYFSNVPPSKQAQKHFIAITAIRSHMNEDYWKKCRLYRLPVKYVEEKKLAVDSLGFVAPQNSDGKTMGIFPIISYERKTRAELNVIYDNHKLSLGKNTHARSEEDEYYLFWLRDPINENWDLAKLQKGQIVEVQVTVPQSDMY